ncbi:acyl-CoA dehydrogenase [Mycolicibacterium sp. CH28]|uniref:acyl-CoA dehydrogenase family protein n=1 Tax=Mycolicibacterium sp. CH28 TaxID=2512237 RepID=UPI0010805E0C|nr:acyl-CoA dehydrogenase family protein [Mycolicibacterium sp. CH28]TGD87073.1 acyl-CoA dehydrogenase [Mycolicibacterium sp. CH28]
MPNTSDESWPIVEEAVQRLFAELPDQHIRIGRQLAEMGWAEIESEYPIESTELLFYAQGRHLAQTDCLDRVILAELADVLLGSADAVLLPFPDIGARDDQHITGIVLGPLHGHVAVPVMGPLGTVSVAVVDADELHGSAVDTFDPTVCWTRVGGSTGATALADSTQQWSRAIAAAQRALGSELTAITEQTLRIAVEHVSVRVQFGSPIGAFQAPRHLLADAWAYLESARALVADSWCYGGPLSAQVAKAAAGRAHRRATDAALQVCGAIGLTAEHPLHRYVTRGVQIDALCGSYRQLEAQLAEQLLADGDAAGALPAVITCC